jgi:soluble P-type ATPase
VTVTVNVPGRPGLRLEHLLLDVNGTLTDRGRLLPGVADRIALVRHRLDVRLLSADTYGALETIAAALGGTPATRVSDGAGKTAVLTQLDPAACVAVGNGANDAPMLQAAALGIAVIGPEGASPRALQAADVVCVSIAHALDLLLDPMALLATLRP